MASPSGLRASLEDILQNTHASASDNGSAAIAYRSSTPPRQSATAEHAPESKKVNTGLMPILATVVVVAVLVILMKRKPPSNIDSSNREDDAIHFSEGDPLFQPFE